ncbi:MAG: TetR/AcrR family transcriptional regulator [Candidatus Aminicenantia bacterium]
MSQKEKRNTHNKQEVILQAALELFTERGFHGTAMPLVAERANVGMGTIYRYFQSKEALVNRLYQKLKNECYDVVMKNFPFKAPIREQFHEFWYRIIIYYIENPLAFSFCELHYHLPYLDEISLRLQSKFLEPIIALFEQAKKEQIIKNLPSALLISIVHGAMVAIIKNGQDGKFELTPEVVEQAENCCWEAIHL